MMTMKWNCVVCDSDGEVPYGLVTTMAELLSEIVLQHERARIDCPHIYTGIPRLSIWEAPIQFADGGDE
jgi:hypothetical protein